MIWIRSLGVALVAVTLAIATSKAQTPGPAVPRPGAVDSAPLAPPPSPAQPSPAPAAPASPPAATVQPSPPPAATIQQSGPPGATITQPAAPGTAPPVPAPGVTAARPPLVAEPGDPTNVDEVVLPEKPVLILAGTSTWEEGLKNLWAAFDRIEAELKKLGVTPTGRPVAVFTQTTDDNFSFDAMVPVAAAPTSAATLPTGLRFGTTPSGKAYRFVHKGPYDDIDTTYETITTYLDAKDILAKDAFIEEYTTEVKDTADPALEINIYVQPR